MPHPLRPGWADRQRRPGAPALAERYLANPFFTDEKRRSLDRNDFCRDGRRCRAFDGARTLAFVTAAAIFRSAEHLDEMPKTFVICGGGRHNDTIMGDLRSEAERIGAVLLTAEQAGFDGDAMEAEAWAYLAVRSLKGLPLTFPATTGSKGATGGLVAVTDAIFLARDINSLFHTFRK